MSVIYKKNKYSNRSPSDDISISIITPTFRINYLENILQNFLRQNYVNKELIIVLNNNSLDIGNYIKKIREYNNIKVLQIDEQATLGECRNFGINNSSLDYIAMFDDDDFYSPNYLNQAAYTLINKKCDVVGKLTAFVYFERIKYLGIWNWNMYENRYSPGVVDSTLVFNRKVLEKAQIPNIDYPELTEFQKSCLNNDIRFYSTDRYNYVFHRHSNPEKQHTWKKSEENFLKETKIILRNVDDYTKYVIK